MKPYPSITNVLDEFLGRDCVAFHKLDGSNLRFLWSKKKGWCRYGTRTRLFDTSDPDFGNAIIVFHRDLADKLEEVILRHRPKTEEFVVYAEFFGPSSFAGQHSRDEAKILIPFDVNIHKWGFLPPEEFIKVLSEVRTPEVVYRGELTQEFIDKVVEGHYDVGEGVIVKGCEGKPPHGNWSAKIKTKQYLQKLKDKFQENWKTYW